MSNKKNNFNSIHIKIQMNVPNPCAATFVMTRIFRTGSIHAKSTNAVRDQITDFHENLTTYW
jgi:hypothetical protein